MRKDKEDHKGLREPQVQLVLLVHKVLEAHKELKVLLAPLERLELRDHEDRKVRRVLQDLQEMLVRKVQGDLKVRRVQKD